MAKGPEITPQMQYLYTHQQQAEQQAAQDKADAAAKLAALRTSATGAARTNANQYFSDRGLDPSAYGGAIDTKINDVLSTTAEDDPNVASYLSNLGEGVYGSQTDALRGRSLNAVNSQFAPNFEQGAIADTADDPFISSIDQAQRGSADDFITNLLKRHVITDVGAQTAGKNLDDQGARVRTQLGDLGKGLLSSGRQSLTDIANQGRQTASTLNLGQTFDPNTFKTQADTSASSFLSGLGDSLKSAAPGNLYDTSGLAAIAGAGQGAGNTNFDPRALAGLNIGGDDTTDPLKTKSRAVF